MSRYVVSLGGNALGKNAEEQKQLLRQVAKPIVELIKAGHEVVIAHGNGPQVGMINLAFSESSSTPNMPFPECGAMSQGYIGFHMQNAIGNELHKQGIEQSIAALVTQVIVDKDDEAFDNPRKPIGSFYTKEKADQLSETMGYTMVEDAGRGYRRVVPSPMPIDVKEKEMVKTLLHDGHIVITVGGGGIPVIKQDGLLHGVAAVIDKDNASEKLAELIDADYLVILTAVDNVYIHFGTEKQEALHHVTTTRLQKLIEEGHFAPGSMLPKIKATTRFTSSGKTAIIASLNNAKEAFELKAGTIITQ
ncbi:carbamate kinase [Candidatus Xianfuyuplasma coldseepsis]|uniref:Carbamate kinase n=1 Tax=Candidatus Xianfuyuplasma coldseepsis TaxID=2782163 RepID=A0A7L7KQS6_9MOLU|nr:carbamate kinase [Xianfuyuplasma coldseepsis]QMS85171.1 carbamate kinase [Xianfuyuplasma coldseepsis]